MAAGFAPGRNARGWIPSVANLALVPPSTTPEDRQAIWVNARGRIRWAHDAATFARDLKSTGLIEPTGGARQDGPGRPAALYRFKSSELTWGAGRRKRIHPA
ncbi:MAG: NrtR DNA-binding winged helix domain-containing protein [Solirubrobacteraceae bacterium]